MRISITCSLALRLFVLATLLNTIVSYPLRSQVQEWPAERIDSFQFRYSVEYDSLLNHEKKLIKEIKNYLAEEQNKEESYLRLEEMILNKKIYPYQITNRFIQILIENEAYASLCRLLGYFKYNSFYSVRPTDVANYPTVFMLTEHAGEDQRKAFLKYILETDCLDYRAIFEIYGQDKVDYTHHYFAMWYLFARDEDTRKLLSDYASKWGNRFRRKFIRRLLEN